MADDDFASRFDSFGGITDTGFGAGYSPAMGLLMAQRPEDFARAAASAGIAPPPANFDTAPQVPSLGESMAPVAAPTPALAPTAAAKTPDLAATLRAVAPPKAPEVQKISSPRVNPPHSQIQTGQLMQLLGALGAGQGRRAF